MSVACSSDSGALSTEEQSRLRDLMYGSSGRTTARVALKRPRPRKLKEEEAEITFALTHVHNGSLSGSALAQLICLFTKVHLFLSFCLRVLTQTVGSNSCTPGSKFQPLQMTSRASWRALPAGISTALPFVGKKVGLVCAKS